jgi:hypothetical protein
MSERREERRENRKERREERRENRKERRENRKERREERKKERDYKKEYREYHGKPKQLRRRAGRNAARAAKTKQVGKKAMANKDVHHKNGNPTDNSPSNLQLTDPHDNRGKLREAIKEGSSYG